MGKFLLLTRGAPGVGKSTTLRELGLAAMVVSPDQIRCEIGGLYQTKRGIQERGHFEESDVWLRVEKEILDRMQKKIPVIVDATFQRIRDFKMPIMLAKRFQYSLDIIDFTAIPESIAQERNAERTGWQYVPPSIISKAYTNFRKEKLDKRVNCIRPENFTDTALHNKLLAFTNG